MKSFLILLFSGLAGSSSAQTPLTVDLTVLPTVLARSQIDANYGKRLGAHYYVVSLTIVNSSSESILLQAVAFQPSNGPVVNVVPIATVLQDIRRQEELAFRTRTRQILTYVSLVLPAPTPFFKNALHRGAYNQALSLFNLGSMSIGDAFPDYYDAIVTLLQTNKLFTKNFQIEAQSSSTVDVFISREQINAGRNPTAAQIQRSLGWVKIYSIGLPGNAMQHSNTNELFPAP